MGGSDIILTSLTGLGLDPLADYGGPSDTMALLPGSPALGAGTVETGISTDQRGEPIDSPIPDIGAFQSQGFDLTPATRQYAAVRPTGTSFANPLAVTITAKNPDDPVIGGVLSFTINPASNGASASLSTTTAIIGTDGTAQVMATANAIAGSYTAVVSAGGAMTAEYALSNLFQPNFSALASPIITYGAASVTITGTLADGSHIPSGENVAVTLNGVTLPAVIGSGGDFSTMFTGTASLAVAGSPYTISFAYTTDGTFASASTTSMLTVNPATLEIVAIPESKAYGTADPILAYTATGFQFSDSAASVLTARPDPRRSWAP